MNTLKSITVVWNDGQTDHTFEVDLEKDCALFWGDKGWEVLEKHYKHAHVDKDKEAKVRSRSCDRATPRQPGSTAPAMATPTAAFAIKTQGCIPTQSS